MTVALADSVTNMTLENLHPGGYFWKVARSDRDQVVRRLSTRRRRIAVIAHSELEAASFAERLTLSGLPVVLAADPSRAELVEGQRESRPCTIVTTSEFAVEHGPVPVSLALHLRAASSLRNYGRRVDAVPAAVHITFVTPEDQSRADALLVGLRKERDDDIIDVMLEEVIYLTDGDSQSIASIAVGRRRSRPTRRNPR